MVLSKKNIALLMMAGTLLPSCSQNASNAFTNNTNNNLDVSVRDSSNSTKKSGENTEDSSSFEVENTENDNIEENNAEVELSDSHLLELDTEIAESNSGTESTDGLRKNITTNDGIFKIKSATLAVWNNLDMVFTVANVPTDSTSHGIYFWWNAKTSIDDYKYDGNNTDGYLATSYDVVYEQEGHDDYWCLHDGVKATQARMSFGQFTDYVYAVAWSYNGSKYTNSAPVKYSALTYSINKKNSTTKLSNGQTIAQYLPTLRDFAYNNQVSAKQSSRPANGEHYHNLKTTGGYLADGFNFGLYNQGETVKLATSYWSTNGSTVANQFSNSILMGDEDIFLTNVEATEGLTIEGTTVTGGNNLSGEVVIPEGVTEITATDFGNITKLVAPDTLTKLNPDKTFMNNTTQYPVFTYSGRTYSYYISKSYLTFEGLTDNTSATDICVLPSACGVDVKGINLTSLDNVTTLQFGNTDSSFVGKKISEIYINYAYKLTNFVFAGSVDQCSACFDGKTAFTFYNIGLGYGKTLSTYIQCDDNGKYPITITDMGIDPCPIDPE